jgi:exopolysaccharide biosynthesis WecB/TagA/CpsF family protein
MKRPKEIKHMTHNSDAIPAGSINMAVGAGPEMPSTGAQAKSHEFRGQRLADITLSFALITVLSPLIIVRAAIGLLTSRRLFQAKNGLTANDEVNPSTVRFAGEAPGAGLAGLFNVAGGTHTLVASGVSGGKPGLFSAARIRRELGVDYLAPQTEVETSCEWCLNTYLKTLAKSILASVVSPVRLLQSNRNFHVFGVEVFNSSMAEALDDLEERLESGAKSTVGFVNADCLNKCFSNTEYHETLRAMERVYPDGIGVRLAAQMFGNGVEENINGTDLFPLLCQRLSGTSHGIFLLGAREGLAEKVAEKMTERYSGITFSGCQHGYFSAENEDDVINKINASGASVLLVALGAPQQELWLAKNRDRLNVRILMGVGGLFDFYSGRIERAPVWVREIGLEWVWRLLQEPGRMWRRYVIGNPLFLYRVWRQKKRNGSVGRLMQVTPAEEATVIEHFGKLGQGASLRSQMMKARQIYWKMLRASGANLKRATDAVASVLLFILLSPLFLLVILLVRLDSPGPAFYSQMRVGYRGKQFRLWKFRSMYLDAEHRLAELQSQNEVRGGVIFKMKKDPRITRVGSFIRKTSIDELPQLWNVIRGDMSLVGPRPALESEVARYTIEERVRLMAKPGLTCIWQVSGRSDIPFSQQVLLDEDYLYRQSLFTDIKLLLQTIPAVLRGKGAY